MVIFGKVSNFKYYKSNFIHTGFIPNLKPCKKLWPLNKNGENANNKHNSF